MTKFKKKPEVIEAFQLTYNVAKGKDPIPTWAKEQNDKGNINIIVTDKIEGSEAATIKTGKGVKQAYSLDYVVLNESGELDVMHPKQIERDYDVVTD